MIKDKEFYEEIKSLKEKFGLTEEEIEGYIEFQKIHKIKSKLVINGRKNGITKICC